MVRACAFLMPIGFLEGSSKQSSSGAGVPREETILVLTK